MLSKLLKHGLDTTGGGNPLNTICRRLATTHEPKEALGFSSAGNSGVSVEYQDPQLVAENDKAAQMHMFSEKARFDSSKYKNAEEPTGAAAVPGDTGSEREISEASYHVKPGQTHSISFQSPETIEYHKTHDDGARLGGNVVEDILLQSQDSLKLQRTSMDSTYSDVAGDGGEGDNEKKKAGYSRVMETAPSADFAWRMNESKKKKKEGGVAGGDGGIEEEEEGYEDEEFMDVPESKSQLSKLQAVNDRQNVEDKIMEERLKHPSELGGYAT